MKQFPKLDDVAQADSVEKALHWSLANGLVMYPSGFEPYNTDHAPVTLFPTPFPKDGLDSALEVQPAFNKLYAKVASDETWLESIISELIDLDRDFTGKLWDTYKKAKTQGISQPLALGLVRSDYMLDQITNRIKQIEYNAISVSFGGLSPKVAALHKYLNKVGAYSSTGTSEQHYKDSELAGTESSVKLAEGLADAVALYHGEKKTTSIVLFVVQENERNVFDQRHLEYCLLEQFGIRSQRVTLANVPDVTLVDPVTKILRHVPTGDEISVVYYRTGYGPADYASEQDWTTRLNLEVSKAIKCPTLLSQLSGSKKIQQLLTDDCLLQNYLSQSEIESLMRTFVTILPLDDSEAGKKAKMLAFENPDRYVLKPQREGGGNNIYKQDIPKFLLSIPESQWNAYILMDMIVPPSHRNLIIRQGKVYRQDVVSELGIFGTVVWNSSTGEILSNKTGGYLLRSKFSTSNEGGVAAGFGCVDSLYLY